MKHQEKNHFEFGNLLRTMVILVCYESACLEKAGELQVY
jgi:hypothetical protein